MFTSILGDEAGNLALKVLATGGIYLAGGMATHTLPELKSQRFMQAFKNKGRFAEMMGRMPIHVIVTRAALAGAAAYGLENSAPGSEHREHGNTLMRILGVRSVRTSVAGAFCGIKSRGLRPERQCQRSPHRSKRPSESK